MSVELPFLGWGETFKKQKQVSPTDGRDSQAGLYIYASGLRDQNSA